MPTRIEVNLPSVDKAQDFLRKKYIQTLGIISNDTVDVLKENFAKGRTGAGQNMPPLEERYKRRKGNADGRFKRDLTGIKNGGAMVGSMKPKKKGDGWVVTFGGGELDKARYNQDILNKKGGMRFMSVSKKWVKEMTDFFNDRMKRYMK